MVDFFDMVRCVGCGTYFIPRLDQSESDKCLRCVCIEAASVHLPVDRLAGKLLDIEV